MSYILYTILSFKIQGPLRPQWVIRTSPVSVYFMLLFFFFIEEEDESTVTVDAKSSEEAAGAGMVS